MVKTGVSSACLYPMATEQAVDTLGRLGIRYTEIFINTDSELTPDYCGKLQRITAGHGMEVLALHPYTSGFETFLFFSNYSRRFEDGMEYYKRYYQAANRLGAKYVVFHGGLLAFPMAMEEYCARFERLRRSAAQFGVELIHENVARCVGASPDFFRQMNQLLPEVGYVLDVKQAVRSGHTPQEMLEAMAGHIRHVHISDHRGERDCLPLGDGELDLEAFARQLRQAQPQQRPSLVVELYRSNFSEQKQLCISNKILKDFFIL